MTHQFIKIQEIDKAIPNSDRRGPGAIVVCADCGQVRNIYHDGIVVVMIDGIRPCQNQKQ